MIKKYKKQCKACKGYDPKPAPMDKTTRAIMNGAFIFAAIILILVVILLFTGKIDYIYGEDSFTIAASFWSDLNVDYDEITGIELRDGNVDGTRLGGLGSFRLLLGIFENEEFGTYTRYTYYKPETTIVVTCGTKVLVLSGADAEETQAIYNELTARTEE